MKQYITTKPIEAKPMTRGDYNEYRGWTIPDDENPCDEGYLIKRNDGYVTWLAKETFENDYKEIDSFFEENGVQLTNTFDFSFALEQLKQGKKVARKGWNGKGMFIYMQGGSSVEYEALKETLKQNLKDTACLSGHDYKVHFSSHIDMKSADGTIVIGWNASQVDMFAEDWEVVE